MCGSFDHLRFEVPFVLQDQGTRSLHFTHGEVQSSMRVSHPDELQVDYTRTMMSFLLLNPRPRRITMIGLGGGSLAKFCHRHLPRASMWVVEINPHVIALRDAFQVPPDDARFQVVEADGACFVRETDERFDVLMVDAFDAQGMPAALGRRRFYDDCLDVLVPAGLMVVNLHAGHPHCPVYVERIRRSFGEHVLRVDDRDGANSVIFACKGEALQLAAHGASRRPTALAPDAWRQLQGAFARIASALSAADCTQRG